MDAELDELIQPKQWKHGNCELCGYEGSLYMVEVGEREVGESIPSVIEDLEFVQNVGKADDADAAEAAPSGAEPEVPEEAPVEVEEVAENVTDTATIDELERQIAVLEKMKAEREAEEE